ncbi:hypothetical protein PR003_g30863 [Phytophthora rubi]|uniref:Uncharacterized protein n=1 Tax=Phytophthora rubi TaxID=129364 RepID=A0A6A3H0U3_9STRA|nr:hypothetical protein PR001_g29578 [Phytophthora rubi]KAE9270338.1 hypothetical protein PR003_g30863 [Phytophthora rubi]
MSITKARVHPEGKGAWGKGARNSSRDSTAQTRESDIIMVHSKAKRKFSPWHVFSLLRRLASIAAAIQYVIVSLSAAWYAEAILSGAANPTESFRVFTSNLIEGYIGDGLIRDSPLVQDVLGGDTTPRDYALFLESKTKGSQ